MATFSLSASRMPVAETDDADGFAAGGSGGSPGGGIALPACRWLMPAIAMNPAAAAAIVP